MSISIPFETPKREKSEFEKSPAQRLQERFLQMLEDTGRTLGDFSAFELAEALYIFDNGNLAKSNRGLFDHVYQNLRVKLFYLLREKRASSLDDPDPDELYISPMIPREAEEDNTDPLEREQPEEENDFLISPLNK